MFFHVATLGVQQRGVMTSWQLSQVRARTAWRSKEVSTFSGAVTSGCQPMPRELLNFSTSARPLAVAVVLLRK